jgi:uncharacterized protein (TIGR02145 family)
MAENKNSFIKSKMNKDLDDRLVPNNEYRDAQNIAVSRSEDQDVGALEAVLGNEKVIDSSDGTQCIGTHIDDASGYIYYFMTDNTTSATLLPTSTKKCKILRWQPSSNTSTPQTLVSGVFLNFSTTSRVTGINLLENLLFWTDNRNQPRVINVVTASLNSSYYDSETSVTVCKFAPYLAPDLIDLRSISDLKPSTMSDAENLPVIAIGSYTWATDNLDVTRYRNGDLIPQAESYTDWVNYDTASTGCWCYYDNQLSNGVVYQKLYNRHAVTDSRNLAPYGYTLATEAMFTNLKSDTATGTPGNIKSTDLWTSTSSASNNTKGFDGTPSGQRKATAANDDFANLTTEARYWIADANKYFLIEDNANAPTIVTNSGTKQGYAVRVTQNAGFKGWQGDPEFIKDKFVRFSYRFKFADGEYSIIAPFTQECFIPQQEGWFLNDDEDDAMRSTIIKFMQNSINNIVLNIQLPSLDIVSDYQVSDIDIIYKESDSLAYKILQSIEVTPQFITNLNNTNIYQYTYQSTIPFKTLPTDETTRVYDKVPVRALTQEVAGNRVMYGNFIQGYNAPLGLDYAVASGDRTAQSAEEYPQHSVKQNRNYQVGIILADKWGRQTDVVLSSKDNVLVAGGEPVEGSNYFTTYRYAENAELTKSWTGENLNLTFDSVININGDNSALYAQPSMYTIGSSSAPTYASPWAGFLNYSVQEQNTVASQVCYAWTNMLVGTVASGNTLKLYTNDGSGWVEVTLPFTASTNGSGQLQTCFNSGASLSVSGLKIKLVYLFEGTTNEAGKYRYQLDYLKLDADTTASIANTTALFGVGRSLRGKYVDYTEVKTFAQVGTTDVFNIYTDDEISDNYMFQGDTDPASNPTTRTEPKTDKQVSNFTYNINVNGFYSYRVVVKQQQQEFYNVYLPGIISGYPIQGNTTEIGSTAFCVLVHDNINKVPRQLTEISNQDVQFNSDLTWFGRVTNNTAAGAGNNTQFFPNTTPDSVELIGGIRDVFPEIDFTAGAAGTPPYINSNSIFDLDQKPFVAKISVQKAMGVPQGDFNTTTGSAEYPDVMSLSVYETSPTVSNLDLFWESSTTGLISDINEAVVGSGTAITGLSSFVWQYNEGDCAGSDITTAFFAQTPQGNDVSTTAILSSVYSYDPVSQNLDTSVNRNNEFQIAAAGGGAWKLQNTATNACLTDFEWLQKYQFNIQFTQADGTTSNQSFTRTLANDVPIINLVNSPQPEATDTTILKWTGTAFNGIGKVEGFNGSCDACDKSKDLVWTIQSCRWKSVVTGNWYSEITGTNTAAPLASTDIATYFYIKAQSEQNAATCSGGSPENFYGIWLERKADVSGSIGTLQGDFFSSTLHEVVIQLSDTNGTSASETLAIQFTPSAVTYTGVVANYYTASTTPSDPNYIVPAQHWLSTPTGSGMQPGCSSAYASPTLPIWVGGIQNWTSNKIYIYMKVYSTALPTPAFALQASFGGYNTDTTSAMKAPAYGDGTNGLDPSGSSPTNGPATVAYDTTGIVYSLVGSLEAFTPTAAATNAGVVPGDNASAAFGASQNFKDSAWINCKLEWTNFTDCSAGAKVTLVYDLVGNPAPVSPQNVTAASGVPPFHTSVWYKTSGWPGA